MTFAQKFLPWPGECLGSPVNPARDWLMRQKEPVPALRLCFMPGLKADILLLAAQKARLLYVADFTLPERNLALPMHWLARVLPGRREFWRAGALWGLACQAGLKPFQEQIILGGAGVLAGFTKNNTPATPESREFSAKSTKKLNLLAHIAVDSNPCIPYR